MDQPNWNDLHTPDEWADVLDKHAEDLAREGLYATHSDLRHAAECIRAQAAAIDFAQREAANLSTVTDEIVRKAQAAIESLSKLPS